MIFLTEEQIKYIKEHTNAGLLTESSRDNLLLPYLDIINKKGQNATLGQLKNFLMKKFVTEANIHALSLGSNFYLVGVARYYFNGDLTENVRLNIFYPNVTDKFRYDICQRLDEIIVFLRNAYIDTTGTQWEQPEDFGTLSIAQLFKKYGGRVDKLKNKNAEKPLKYANESNVVSKNYTFDIMYSHEDCKKYNSATSPGAWCITYAANHYNYYTKHPSSHFVIFAKNGYENIQRIKGKNYPLDEYGLSLLAVRQSNVDGGFVGCTTRWNHGHPVTDINNADSALSYDMLKQITGLDDSKFQLIFKIWEENKPKHTSVDRSKAAQDKLFAMRKVKYAQMLYRNGTSLEQLHNDKIIDDARVLFPNIPVDQAKVNKSILSIRVSGMPGENENGESTVNEYYTIMDRGEMKPDKILCNDIIHPSSYYGDYNLRDNRYKDDFAVCTTKSGNMYYFYKLHDILTVGGYKYFKTLKGDFGGDLPIAQIVNIDEGLSVLNMNTLKPIVLPNGEVVSEKIEMVSDTIIQFIYDTSAGVIYYYNFNTGSFINELENLKFFAVNVYNSKKLLRHYNFLSFSLMNPDTHLYVFKLYNINTNKFEIFDGQDEFRKLQFCEGYLGVSTNIEEVMSVYNITTKEQLYYPNGEPVTCVNIGKLIYGGYYRYGEKEKKHNGIEFKIKNGENICSYFDLNTNKFYINYDGTPFFKDYGGGKVYDKNGYIVELPETADGPYWYEDEKFDNADVEKYLKEGVDINELFDEATPLASDDENINDKFIRVELNHVYNIIKPTKEGKYTLLSDKWFEHVGYRFSCGYVVVKLLNEDSVYGNSYNYLGDDGTLLRNKPLQKAEPFNETKKCAIIMDGGYNVIREDGGKILQWNVREIKQSNPPEELYYLIKEDNRQRNYRFLSLNGNVFINPQSAIEDSINGTPRFGDKGEIPYYMNESFDMNHSNMKWKYRDKNTNLDKYRLIIDEIINEYDNSKFDNCVSTCLTKESIDEIVDDYEMNDVMDSFDVQDELNEKIWFDGELNPRVRNRLLYIADKFYNSLEIEWVKPEDIIMTGSLCNYNWSKYSDIDLHILIDFDEVDERTVFVKDYFDTKKKLWNQEHEDLKIYGFPVELYVQDINEEHTASGIYSLQKDEWIKEPERDKLTSIQLDKEAIVDKTNKFVNKIDELERECNNETDIAKLDILSSKVKKLFDRIKHIRKEALKSEGGELSNGNILFKTLRRLGYISKLVELKNKTYDKINTIK